MTLSKETIKEQIQAHIPCAKVIVENPQNDGMHFSSIVISDKFESLSPIEQHKMVKQSLKAYFDSFELHAMSLKTFTYNQWNTLNNKG